MNGIIRHRLFEEGSIVEAGQLLYEIEDAPYRAALRSAQAALTRAEASINATRLQAERYQELASLKAASRQDADNAQAAADQASAEVEVQQAAIHAAKVDLGFTRIRAPISGRIGRSLVTPGALVQAGQAQPLATIQRTDVVHVDVMQSAAETLDLREAMLAGDLIHDSDSVPVELLLPNGNVYPIEGQLQFSGTADSGHAVTIDGPPDIGGENAGFRPMEMILLGVGGCASFDVMSMLQKSRQQVLDCRVEIEAERADAVPAVFTRIHLHFVVTGHNLKEKQVQRAVSLSAEKYCSASIMLAGAGVEITHSYELLEFEAG